MQQNKKKDTASCADLIRKSACITPNRGCFPRFPIKWRTAGVLVTVLLLNSVAFSADLLADEKGPTASEAVSTLTAGDDFLLPSYTVPAVSETNEVNPVPSEIDILNEIFGPDTLTTEVPSKMVSYNQGRSQNTFSPRTGVQYEQDKMPLLTPLTPLPDIQMDTPVDPPKSFFKQAGYADQALAMATSASSGIGMPREIRITFYPGQSAFSEQALKWAKSFAIRVVNHPTTLAEIRVSERNWALQEKRLRILIQILKEAGVSAHQIRLYKTGRDENSILMGVVDNPEYMSGIVKKSTERVQKTIDW